MNLIVQQFKAVDVTFLLYMIYTYIYSFGIVLYISFEIY